MKYEDAQNRERRCWQSTILCSVCTWSVSHLVLPVMPNPKCHQALPHQSHRSHTRPEHSRCPRRYRHCHHVPGPPAGDLKCVEGMLLTLRSVLTMTAFDGTPSNLSNPSSPQMPANFHPFEELVPSLTFLKIIILFEEGQHLRAWLSEAAGQGWTPVVTCHLVFLHMPMTLGTQPKRPLLFI